MSPKELIRLVSASTIGTSLAQNVDIRFVKRKNFGQTDGEAVWLPSPEVEPLHRITHFLNHELLHILLEHVERGRKVVPPDKFKWWVWNLAADDAVTRYLKYVYTKVHKTQTFGASMSALLNDDVDLSQIKDYPKNAPTEVIYRWLLEQKIDFTESKVNGVRIITATVHTKDKRYAFTLIEFKREPHGLFGKDQSVRRFEVELNFRGRLPGNFMREWKTCKVRGINFEKTLNEYLNTFSSLKGEYLTFLVPNKKTFALNSPILLPSYCSKKEKVLVAIDTSGSISEKELSLFINTIHKYAHRLDMDVVFCDAGVSDVLRLQELNLPEVRSKILKARPRGGGSTDYEPVFEYYFRHSSRYKLLIYFTDLWSNFPINHPPRILWAVHLNKWTYKIKPPYGKIAWL